jgi:acetyltransferase-like isoleucine patch superfamily enzyme
VEVKAGPAPRGAARASVRVATIDGNVAAEADLLIGVEVESRQRRPEAAAGSRRGRHPSDGHHPSQRADWRGDGHRPYVTIGEHVTIGRDCRIGASCVLDGVTRIGDGNEFFPMSSIGLVPQDLKFGGEPTRVCRSAIATWSASS